MMKKGLSVLMAGALLLGTLLLGGCSGKVKEMEAVEKTSSIPLPEDGIVRVLQITDLHLTKGKSKKEDRETLKWLEQAIDFARPEIVAITGDAVGGMAPGRGRDKALQQIADILEEKQVYWMYTFGNHDGEWSYTTGTQVGKTAGLEGREELFELLKGYKYSMMQKGDTDGIGNYVVDVVNADEKAVFSFINMDTHGKSYDAEGNDIGYLGLTANQVQWYEREVKATAQRSADGQVTKSALFLHVPLTEYIDAWKNQPHIGGFGEVNIEGKVYAPPEDQNTGCFAKIKELGSTSLVTAGHDHDFNWLRDYDGVYLSYGRCSGVNAWERRAPVGATLIDINVNAPTKEAMYKISVIEPTFDYSLYEGFQK